jgi:hypothetical protein
MTYLPITRNVFHAAWLLCRSVENMATILDIPVRRVLALAYKLRLEGVNLPDRPYKRRSALAILDHYVPPIEFFIAWRTCETIEGVAHRLGWSVRKVLNREARYRMLGLEMRHVPRQKLFTMN